MSATSPGVPTRPCHAVFFGGCVPASRQEERLAYDIGATLAGQGLTLLHGGYNGLMEHAAHGAVESGGSVVAVTLAGTAWGAFNPHVTTVTHQPTMGARMHTYLDHASVIVSMAGGVGTLHELTAALWYAGNIRPVPVVVAGPTARRLLAFLRDERWVYSSPTRPLDFLHEVDSAADLIPVLDRDESRSPAW
ncbi:LOG family protein [Micromonospora sp. NPDC005174]|uniref:SLOG cluster 4 domain-containing protein n=1 Tax=Micromonospora sp. NPDC005174 TaxID=3157018 RepID=UPI0033B6F46A